MPATITLVFLQINGVFEILRNLDQDSRIILGYLG